MAQHNLHLSKLKYEYLNISCPLFIKSGVTLDPLCSLTILLMKFLLGKAAYDNMGLKEMDSQGTGHSHWSSILL